MFETTSTTDKIRPYCPPMMPSGEISPGSTSDILNFLREDQKRLIREHPSSIASSGSTCVFTSKGQEIDLFRSFSKKRLPIRISYSEMIRQPFASPTTMQVMKECTLSEVKVEKRLNQLRPENAALLKLLDQWSKEPQLGDDQWWDDFDRELREIRESGWDRP